MPCKSGQANYFLPGECTRIAKENRLQYTSAAALAASREADGSSPRTFGSRRDPRSSQERSSGEEGA